jgi:hypothetical protein
MSSYIVAHIVFDKSELISVDIVDETHIIESGTITEIMTSKNTDFYIKILVEKCDRQIHDCFALSNGTYYKLDFNKVITSETLVNGDFLKNSGAPNIINVINRNGNGPNGANPIGANPIGANQTPSINEFKELIVSALTGASFEKSGLEGFKELIVKALTSNFGKSGLEEFKSLIVNVLNTVSDDSSSVDTNSLVETNSSANTNSLADTNTQSVAASAVNRTNSPPKPPRTQSVAASAVNRTNSPPKPPRTPSVIASAVNRTNSPPKPPRTQSVDTSAVDTSAVDSLPKPPSDTNLNP